MHTFANILTNFCENLISLQKVTEVTLLPLAPDRTYALFRRLC